MIAPKYFICLLWQSGEMRRKGLGEESPGFTGQDAG